MCLAPSICSLDVGFFDKGTTAYNFAQIQNQYLLPCRFEFAFRNWPRKIHEIGLLMPIETS
jgi:hypothetical protein